MSSLARCSASRFPVSDSSDGQDAGAMEPSLKKQRVSAPNSTLNTRGRNHEETSKVSLTCMLCHIPFLFRVICHCFSSSFNLLLMDPLHNGPCP